LVEQLRELKSLPALPGVGYGEEIARLQRRLEELRGEESPTVAWKTVQAARAQGRPQTLEYLSHLAPDFIELHGDRLAGDDPAIVGGVGSVAGKAMVFLGHQKGRDLKERQQRNFGMARPEGYRKAQRLALLAERHSLPVVCLIDTPGAFPGVEAERGGQAGAIARTLQVFAGLQSPTVAFVIGEGGSGGALALGLCDRVFMLETAIYSVISPEACAALVWRDASEAPRAAEALHLTAPDLLTLGVIDGIISEPRRGVAGQARVMSRRLKRTLSSSLEELGAVPPEVRRRLRRQRYLNLGVFAG